MSDPMQPYVCGEITEWAPIASDYAEETARTVIAEFDGWLESGGFSVMQVAEIERTIASAIRVAMNRKDPA